MDITVQWKYKFSGVSLIILYRQKNFMRKPRLVKSTKVDQSSCEWEGKTHQVFSYEINIEEKWDFTN